MERGAVDGVAVDGLNFSVYANWPGAIHEGNGEALILVDERADERQRAAIATLVGGTVGGPWGTLAWTWPRSEVRWRCDTTSNCRGFSPA